MTIDYIIRMAHKCGLCSEDGRDTDSVIIAKHLERFANLVAAAERDKYFSKLQGVAHIGGCSVQLVFESQRQAEKIIAAIRARGQE